VLNSMLVLAVTYRLLSLYSISSAAAAAGKRKLLAGFAAAVFLLHPIQTESVSYIASRSETLCAFFMLSALALFLYRLPGPITWPAAASILVLFGAACTTKEHAVALAPVLLLADLFWGADLVATGLRKNWRLYLPLLGGGLIAGLVALRIILESTSAGFRLREFTWLQYFFTECRAFFSYIQLLIFPAGQTIDHEISISKNILDHGSIFGLIGIVALVAAAIWFRRRYRLASFGFLVFLILLAPTSSFIPLIDPLAEHRLYLPIVGLTLVLLEFLLRARISQKQMAAVCTVILAVCCVLTFTRNQLWGDDVLLWRDAVEKAPDRERPYSNLAAAYIVQHRCDEAETLLEQTPGRMIPQSVSLLTVWGRTQECRKRFDEAAELIGRVAKMKPQSSLYIEIGLMRARQGKAPEAYEAFSRAIELDPRTKQGYILRGEWYEAAERFDMAVSDYRRAVQLNPDNTVLREHLAKLEQRLQLSGSARLGSPGKAHPERP
jgi:tetratricopeptide (TPR) repeat protein